MKLQVYRTNASSYQSSNFLVREQTILEEIPGVKYINSLKETLADTPFVLITNTHTNIDEVPKPILDKTVLLVHPNSGHENFPDEFLKSASFPIIVGNPIRSNAVAEYTLSCLFKEFTTIENHRHWKEDRSWERRLLRDQKVLIIGHGHIGSLIAKSLSPLVSKLKVLDPHCEEEAPYIEKNFSLDLFDDVNVLIVAADLNETSRNLITKEALNKLASKNLIINPARSEILNEDDLALYLQKNPGAKCFLDVFNEEPFKPGYLNHIENLNKTSHIAGVHKRLNHDIISFEYLVIKDFLQNYHVSQLNSEFQKEYSNCIINNENLKSVVL